MKEIRLDPCCLPLTVPIGRRGENEAAALVFDCSGLENAYGSGTAVLLHQRSGDALPYPVSASMEGATLTWRIGSADTAHEGCGKAQLHWVVGETLAKTAVFTTQVFPALCESEELPESTETALDRIVAALANGGIAPPTGRTPLDLSDESDENYTEDGYDVTGLANGAYDIVGAGLIVNPEADDASLNMNEGALLIIADGTVVAVCDLGNYYFSLTDGNWADLYCITKNDLLIQIQSFPTTMQDIVNLDNGLYYLPPTNNHGNEQSVLYKDTVNSTNYYVNGLIEVIDGVHYVYHLGMKFGTLTRQLNSHIKSASVARIDDGYTKSEVDAAIAAAIADVSALIGGASS